MEHVILEKEKRGLSEMDRPRYTIQRVAASA